MKRNFAFFVISLHLIAPTLSAQSIKTKDNALQGPVKTITWSTYSVVLYNGEAGKYKLKNRSVDHFDRKGYKVLSQHNLHDSSKMFKTTYEWDAKGNLLQEVDYYSGDSLRYTQKYTYDENNNPLLISKFYSKGNLKPDTEEFIYNAQGKLIEHIFYVNELEIILARWLYEYDEDGNRFDTRFDLYGRKSSSKGFNAFDEMGNIVYQADIDRSGNMTPRVFKKYDESGRLLEYDSYWEGQLKSKSYYQYDELGNTLTSHKYDPSGNLISEYSYKYEFDQQGNWTNRVEISSGYPIKILERKIEYD